MNTLQSAAVAAATAFLVLAFCTGIKAACRKKLRQDKNDKAIHDGSFWEEMKKYSLIGKIGSVIAGKLNNRLAVYRWQGIKRKIAGKAKKTG